MFGIGGQEIIIIGIIFLVIFGPSKLPQMARDIGRFVGEARRSIDEFKEELTSAVDDEEGDKTSHQQRRKNTPTKKEKEPAKTANEDVSAESNSEKEEYDF